MFRSLSLTKKLVITFLLIGLIPLAVVGYISTQKSVEALNEQITGQLASIRESKGSVIQNFFIDREGGMNTLSRTVNIMLESAYRKLEVVQQLKKVQIEGAFRAMSLQLKLLKEDPLLLGAIADFMVAFTAAGKEPYSEEWEEAAFNYDFRLAGIAWANGWDDLYLISPQGEIVYSSGRGEDLGLTIESSVLSATSMGKALRITADIGEVDVVITDFAAYPFADEPVAIMMTQLIDPVSNTLLGYVAARMPTTELMEIAQRRDGMGDSGESYLVARMGSKNYFRSNQVIRGGEFAEEVSDIFIDKVFEGETGTELSSNREGVLEIVSYVPLEVSGLQWAIISVIRAEEIISPQAEGEMDDYYTQYTTQHGYDDLLLIDPGGKVFYSVLQASDYQMNLLEDQHSDSPLAGLFRQVIDEESYLVADFSPYQPADGAPAAFIAMPILRNDEVSLVVALRLSPDAISSMMVERAGMGDTGESYLIGEDFLMRSDSYRDPEAHSVISSFSSPEAGSVRTVAAERALSGESGDGVFSSYDGKQVLSSFTPIYIGDMTWGLLAEIPEDEAFSAVYDLIETIVLIALVMIIIIAAVAWLIASGISRPILQVATLMRDIADSGDFSKQIEIKNKDEIGHMAENVNGLLSELHHAIGEIDHVMSATAEGDFGQRIKSEFSGDLDRLKSSINGSVERMQDAIGRVNEVMQAVESGDFEQRIKESFGGVLTTQQ